MSGLNTSSKEKSYSFFSSPLRRSLSDTPSALGTTEGCSPSAAPSPERKGRTRAKTRTLPRSSWMVLCSFRRSAAQSRTCASRSAFSLAKSSCAAVSLSSSALTRVSSADMSVWSLAMVSVCAAPCWVLSLSCSLRAAISASRASMTSLDLAISPSFSFRTSSAFLVCSSAPASICFSRSEIFPAYWTNSPSLIWRVSSCSFNCWANLASRSAVDSLHCASVASCSAIISANFVVISLVVWAFSRAGST
mmetsp:Transcript_26005/g.60722  ORF Transcript_26005/g.60722 Transcript_26005/m.60722 type:complete len:249 (-) Transcript_26005:289-1035(-)